MKKLNILITGANGFVGQNLLHLLSKDKAYYLKALYHHNSENLKKWNIEKIKGDVLNLESLKNAFKNVDVVFHLASIISIDCDDTEIVWRTNVEGAANVAEAALFCKVKRVVHMSSIHAFDIYHFEDFLNEQSPKSSIDKSFPYDASKAAGELEMLKRLEKGLDVVVVNPTGIIGPFDVAPSLNGDFLIKLAKRKYPFLIRGGFDWVDSRDVAKGALLAYKKGKKGENYILSGRYASFKEISKHVSQIGKIRTSYLTIPYLFALLSLPLVKFFSLITGKTTNFSYQSLNTTQIKKNISSLKAQQELGYRPRDLVYTLKDFYAFLSQSQSNDI